MIVGLTGGIGSGKSTVAAFFKTKGIPVYVADTEAKKIMQTNKDVKQKIIAYFGASAYLGDVPNNTYLSEIVFKDKRKLEELNAIIHPKVANHFKEWLQIQQAPYVIKEVAILHETGGDKACDIVITVTAPVEVRINRVMARDHIDEAAVKARMKNQWSDERKIANSDLVIENINLDKTRKIVDKIHVDILKNKM